MIRLTSTAANKKCRQWDVLLVLPIDGIFAERCICSLLTINALYTNEWHLTPSDKKLGSEKRFKETLRDERDEREVAIRGVAQVIPYVSKNNKATPYGVVLSVYSVAVDYANSSTSDASEALIYAAASAIFFAAYFTKIFVGFK